MSKNKQTKNNNSKKLSLPGSNRRTFVKSTAALGLGLWAAGGVSAKPSLSANEEIRFGCIGIGGKGSSDSESAKQHGKVVAICDIDRERLGGATDKFPGASQYTDYRKMLEEKGNDIDAVTVSTPDHTHAPASIRAMEMGKDIRAFILRYCASRAVPIFSATIAGKHSHFLGRA